jgi:hypothetical protein
MNDALLQAIWRLVIPALVAGGLAIYLGRSSSYFVRRYAFAVPVAVGFVLGHWLNPDRLPLVPDRHWQWLPYLTLLVASVGGFSRPERYWGERAAEIALLGFTVVAAVWLVPTWESLQPPWPVMILLLCVYLFVLPRLMLTWPYPAFFRNRRLLFLTTGVLFATVAYIAIEVSLKIGGSLVPAVAAMSGVCLASLWLKRDNEIGFQFEIAGLIPVFALIAGGGAFVGAIELPEPRYLLLFIPASPLMLWLFAFGPLAKFKGSTAIIAQTIAVAIVPIAIFAWTLLQPEPSW